MIKERIDVLIENFRSDGIEIIEANIMNVSEEINRLRITDEKNMTNFHNYLKNRNIQDVFLFAEQYSEEHLIREEVIDKENYGRLQNKVLKKVRKYNEMVTSKLGEIYFAMFYAFHDNVMIYFDIKSENNEIQDESSKALEMIESEFEEELFDIECENDDLERKEKELEQQQNEDKVEAIIMQDEVFLNLPTKEAKVYSVLQISNRNGLSLTKTDVGALVDIIQTKIKMKEERKTKTNDSEKVKKELEEKILNDEIFANVTTKDAKVYRAAEIIYENGFVFSKTDIGIMVEILQTKEKLAKRRR